MHANDIRSTAAIRHGAYLCLQLSPNVARALSAIDIPALASRLDLHDEFNPPGDHPARAIAYLRRVSATPAALADDGLLRADVVIHVAADDAATVDEFRSELTRHIGDLDANALRTLSGVVRPPNYTGTAMHNFAYARRVLQQPGQRMPNAFLMPLSKVPEWWSKTWLERHTYFLPRYDAEGNMLNEGHALVAEPGISCLLRRTYKPEQEPAAAGSYDFINYFECADADVDVFHAVCAGLRDRQRNPEWRFVLEGPTWHGRRVATLSEACR